MMNLEGRIAVVTGGSRGIGRSICLRLAELGADIAVNYNNSEESAQETVELVKRLGQKAICVKADVSNTKAVEEMFENIKKVLGIPDILINNSGITRDGLLLRMKEDDFDRVIEINLKGVFNCTKVASRLMMKKRYGRIVNITSVSGIIGNAGQSNYSASKAGVIGFTKSVAKELASRNILVNAVAPGMIETEMTEVLKDDVKESLLSAIPLKRAGSPEEVAKLVSFLSSNDCNYLTGQVIAIDGGLTM